MQRSGRHHSDLQAADAGAEEAPESRHAARIATLVRLLRDPGRPVDRDAARRLTAARLTAPTGP